MRARVPLALVFAAVGLAPPALAQLLHEDFEHGQTSLYTAVSSSSASQNMVIEAQAAHDGALGANFAVSSSGESWYYRTDVVTAPGNTFRAYVKSSGGTARAYIGLDAGPSGAFSIVPAWNTGTLLIQENANYGYNDIASVAVGWQLNVWYLLELEWGPDGSATARVYDEFGANLIAQTPTVQTAHTTAGGLALRGFVNTGAGLWVDTITDGAGSSAYLFADVTQLSLGLGGVANFDISGGSAMAGNPYLLLGSHSGTSPGLPVDATQTLPLNIDAYWLYTLTNPNTPPLAGSFGILDANGKATASFTLPGGTNPLFAGIDVHHAFVVIDTTTTPGVPVVAVTSQAATFQFLP